MASSSGIVSNTNVQEQKDLSNDICGAILPCSHPCGGVKGEDKCPPCITSGCGSNVNTSTTRDDNCAICYTDKLIDAPIVMMKCSHMFHLHCVKRVLEVRWHGPRITFTFMLCPLCKKPMEHIALDTLLQPIQELKNEVERKCLTRVQYDGLDKSLELLQNNSQYNGKPLNLAMDRYCYYQCTKCGKAYFGGNMQCIDGVYDLPPTSLQDLICPTCSTPKGEQVKCTTHGEDFLQYKCRYCCSIAVYFCFGTTRFCNTCHSENVKMGQMSVDQLPKCPAGPGGKQLTGPCPLNMDHPPAGTEFYMGCAICLNMQTF